MLLEQRSSIAASRMDAAGFADVSDLLGGYGAWETAQSPTGPRRETTGSAGATTPGCRRVRAAAPTAQRRPSDVPAMRESP